MVITSISLNKHGIDDVTVHLRTVDGDAELIESHIEVSNTVPVDEEKTFLVVESAKPFYIDVSEAVSLGHSKEDIASCNDVTYRFAGNKVQLNSDKVSVV